MRSRKGSLNISVEAIVILILAITMLGLGLTFMKNLFGQTTSQLGDIAQDIKNQKIKDLQNSDERLNFDSEDLKVEKGESKEVYFAIKNDDDSLQDTEFSINFRCTDQIKEDASFEDITFEFFKVTKKLALNEIQVMKVIAGAKPKAKSTTYSCNVDIKDHSDNDYAHKDFFVTVP